MITAVVLGNGASRKGFDYRKEYPNATVYGCNGAYIEDIDVVICNDPLRQKNILDSGFCDHGICCFGHWEDPGNGLMLKKVIKREAEEDGHYIIESGLADPQDHHAFRVEATDVVYMFHLGPNSNILCFELDDEAGVTSGVLALDHAVNDGHREIVLIGFDDINDPDWSSLYEGHSGYENHIPKHNWLPDIERSIDSRSTLSSAPKIIMRKVK